MASMPKPDPTWAPMTATELLAIRGTPEFEMEYNRQRAIIAKHQRENGAEYTYEFHDEDYPGWVYDAEI